MDAVRTRGTELVVDELVPAIRLRGVLIGPREVAEVTSDCRGVRAGMTTVEGVARRAIQGSVEF